MHVRGTGGVKVDTVGNEDCRCCWEDINRLLLGGC